jgi:Xaa-Pro aminopeptidase
VEIEAHRAAQRLAYDCAEAVGATLDVGVTEREAARRMRAWLRARGVSGWLHTPFAWFGDRTAFRGVRQPLDFFPTSRRLERGMPFILDCAPVVEGAAADIGYASSLGPNPVLAQLLADLESHRALILRGVRERRPLRVIYADVAHLARRQGLETRHQKYPFRVLAHRISSLPEGGGRVTFAGFGLRSLRALGADVLEARRAGWSPLWSDARSSDHPATPGLWAVEPHLALRGVGAKFEEMLVVDDDDACWLDDDLPHVRGWSARGAVA